MKVPSQAGLRTHHPVHYGVSLALFAVPVAVMVWALDRWVVPDEAKPYGTAFDRILGAVTYFAVASIVTAACGLAIDAMPRFCRLHAWRGRLPFQYVFLTGGAVGAVVFFCCVAAMLVRFAVEIMRDGF